MNQTLNDLIKELGTKKQVKVEYLLPKLRKIKREIGTNKPKKGLAKDSFGNKIYIGDNIYRSDIGDVDFVIDIRENEYGVFEGMSGDKYCTGGDWKFALSVKAYKANPKKYNKLLGIK